MFKMIMGGLAILLLAASGVFWILRPGPQRAEGSMAPDFALQDQNGQMHRLGDYAGRWLVLYFYPRDDTPGCTREACRFRDDIGTLGKLDAVVVGVSVDDTRSHADFSRKYGLPFPLLSDPDGRVARAYGSLLGVFICGNGGSAGNALHLANDFLYGVSKKLGSGLRVNALSANASVMTCLANDVGYEHIYSAQLAVQGREGDVLIVFSGSGNSPNIIYALEQARASGVKSYAILGYSGGKAKEMADVAIHFEIDDMQISEDMQLILGHMIVQWLNNNQPN